MNEVTVPGSRELCEPVLRAIHSLGGSGSNREILQKVIQREVFTSAQVDLRMHKKDGSQIGRLEYHVLWAKTFLKYADLITNPRRGFWQLTEHGKKTYSISVSEVESARASHQRRLKSGSDDKHRATAPPSQPVTGLKNSVFLNQLESTLRQRRIRRPPNSYSAQLFTAGSARIAQKVGEEALEVIIAALHETRERQISEVADLLVHTLILLVELNIPLEEVLAELQRRHEARTS